MGEISRINNQPDAMERVRNTHPAGTARPASQAATQQMPDDASQLTKLSSVLNGLKRGATAMREQAVHAMAAVRSGDYHVDPLQVSRRIVLDSLAWRR